MILSKKPRVIVDLGAYKTKILDITLRKNKVLINQAHSLPGLFQTNYPTAEKIKELVEFLDSIYKKSRVLLTFSSPQSDAFLVNVPTKEKNIGRYITNQLHPPLNGQTLLQEYNIGFAQIHGRQYLAAYVPAKTTREIVAILKEHQHHTVAVDTNASALIYLSKLYKNDEAVLVLDIGYVSSKLLITTKEKVVAYTHWPLGARSLFASIGEQIGVNIWEAEGLVARLGIAKSKFPANINEILTNNNITTHEYTSATENASLTFVNSLLEALMQTQQTFKASESRLVLVGGGGQLRGMADLLQESLGVTVEPFEVITQQGTKLSIVNKSNKKIDSSFGSAIGLGLRCL